MAFVGNKLLGVDVTRTSTDQEHDLGEIVVLSDGTVARYVLAAEALEAYEPVDYTSGYSASASDANDPIFGVTAAAIASGSYGWVFEKGMVTCQVTGSMSSGTLIKRVADAEGVAAAAIDVDEGGATAHGTGDHSIIGCALSAESGGTATVLLF